MMSDTLTVRDHSEPCEHDRAFQAVNGLFGCGASGCPGGKEIVLRRVEGKLIGRRTLYDFYEDGSVWVVEADPND
jgi:hypothetical protein